MLVFDFSQWPTFVSHLWLPVGVCWPGPGDEGAVGGWHSGYQGWGLSQERLAIFRSLHPHGGGWCLFRLTCFALIPLLAVSTILFVGLLNDLFNLTELPLAAKQASRQQLHSTSWLCPMLARTRGTRRGSERRIISFPEQPLMDAVWLQHWFPWIRNSAPSYFPPGNQKLCLGR